MALLASGCASVVTQAGGRSDSGEGSHYPPRADYEHPVTIRESYDRTEDWLAIESTSIEIGPGLDLALAAALPGQVRRRPADSVMFQLSSFYRTSEPSGAFDGKLSLVFRANGREQVRVPVEHTRESVGGDLVLERLVAPVSLDDFLRVAVESDLTGHVCCRRSGPVFLDITPEVVAFLRDFASRLRPMAVPQGQ